MEVLPLNGRGSATLKVPLTQQTTQTLYEKSLALRETLLTLLEKNTNYLDPPVNKSLVWITLC